MQVGRAAVQGRQAQAHAFSYAAGAALRVSCVLHFLAQARPEMGCGKGACRVR